MPLNLKIIEEEASQLSVEDRAKLVEHLITSLDSGEDVNAEKAWINEAERRYKLFQEGSLKTNSAEHVFEEAYNKLNEKH